MFLHFYKLLSTFHGPPDRTVQWKYVRTSLHKTTTNHSKSHTPPYKRNVFNMAIKDTHGLHKPIITQANSNLNKGTTHHNNKCLPGSER